MESALVYIKYGGNIELSDNFGGNSGKNYNPISSGYKLRLIAQNGEIIIGSNIEV